MLTLLREPTQTLAHRLPELAAHLRASALHLIRIEYSGYDQEGKICAFRGMNAEYCERRVPLEVIRSVALREFIGALLEARYPDWMSGEGSCGDFAWNLTTDTLVHVHRYRCMSAEIARHEGVTP